jgi:hypothetical protein
MPYGVEGLFCATIRLESPKSHQAGSARRYSRSSLDASNHLTDGPMIELVIGNINHASYEPPMNSSTWWRASDDVWEL